jgi:hypothetical protein
MNHGIRMMMMMDDAGEAAISDCRPLVMSG